MDNNKSDSNTPVETLRDGRLKATIWENVNENNERYHTVTLAKTYEDRNGKLQDTSSFSAGELLRVGELAREAHGVIREMRRERSQERQAEAEPEQRRTAPSREERPSRFRNRPEPGMGR